MLMLSYSLNQATLVQAIKILSKTLLDLPDGIGFYLTQLGSY